MLEAIGLILSIIAAILGVIGSFYVSSRIQSNRRIGFVYWICSNPLNLIVLIGVLVGMWSGLSLIILIIMQLYYLVTAFRGYNENKEKV